MPKAVHVTFLGGLGEIGRNCAAVEVEGKILLIDCGLMFPDADMLGVDLVLPDFTWLRERSERIVGCIITHGHEDHHGGLSFLLRDCSFPLIGSGLSLALARNRIEEAGLLDRTEMMVVGDRERISIGPFHLEFVPVTHSVPHALGVAIHTPQGTILHSGDFKLDLTPVDGRLTDLAAIGAIAEDEGIRLLLADSTNADQHGHSRSETTVGKVLYDLFHAHEGRRIVTTCFASHIHRIQQIADAAIAYDRVVATLGMSMKKNVRLAREMGLLTIPDSHLRDIDEVGDLEPGKVCVISTGSQGEPMSALSLMADKRSKFLQLNEDDTVILSSHPIPGNEMNVSKVIDGLMRLGVQVVHSGLEDVHATGHAKADELKTYHSIAKPQWFIPVHGEYKHMVHHAELAHRMGLAEDHILLCEDGDRIQISDDGVRKVERVPAGYLYVDGLGIGDIGHGVLRDRKLLAEEGVVVVIAGVDVDAGAVVMGQEIITRGWVHADEAEDMLDECRQVVAQELKEALSSGSKADLAAYARVVRKTTGRFVSDRTRRRPMIVPLIMES
ncbi:ribonuclease J [soil metagenome]